MDHKSSYFFERETHLISHRLGLTEEEAKRLVWTYGLIWNSDPTAEIEFLCVQAEQWWNDFANQYNEVEGGSKNDWARLALYHLYNHMSSLGGSGQVHLLFPPQQVFDYWGSEDPTNLATSTSETGQWLYPGDPSINLEEMSYFPTHFFDQLHTGQLNVMGQNYLVKVSLTTLLRQIWERWHPPS